jgi:CheY-like chemotaxis protein
VSDGDQAIERLEASPPDIVLADIGMPGKNGYEVAQYIRQSPRLSHIPVVLLTGAFEPVDQARAAEAGCDGVLAKPFEPQLVIGRVKELLARSRLAPHGLAAASPAAPDDRGTPPAADEPPFAAASPPEDGLAGLDDYFDRLDAAFSNLPSNAPAAPPAKPSPAPASPPSPHGDAEIDWFTAITPGGAPSTEPWDLPAPPSTIDAPDLPLSYASPEPPRPFDFDAGAASAAAPFAPAPVAPPAPVASSAAVAPSAPVAPSASVAPDARVVPVAPSAPVARPAPQVRAELPPLADAFAALLAAEESEAAPATAPVWPATPPSAVNEQLVDDVTRRVLDRLSDQVVRDTVADIVSKIAEQLVREEIEKIKASIK